MDTANLELLVDRVAASLPPQQFVAFRRLARELAAYETRWGLFLLQYEHVNERDSVAAAIGTMVPGSAIVHADNQQYPDWPSLEAAMVAAAVTARLIQVFGLDDWLASSPDSAQASARLRAWNIRREGFARDISMPIVCWMRPATLRRLAKTAPDLWSWRAGVHDFALPLAPLVASDNAIQNIITPKTGAFDHRTVAQRTLRVREIQQYLLQANAGSLAVRAMLLDELTGLMLHLGHTDEALRILREEQLPIYDKLGDARARAVVLGQIAEILQMCGEPDEALRIGREEVLPTFDKLGDIRGRAVTLAIIADILQIRGEIDEAMRIRRDEVLPIFDKLGDVRMSALTLNRIADIFEIQGNFDEALRIRREEILPVYDKLGDARSRAVTLGQIADILQVRGELEESLHLCREEVLPVFKKFGDVHASTATLSRMANILQACGELDEALRIFHEEVLPVYEKLGDVRALMIAQMICAQILIRRAQNGDNDKASMLLTSALRAAQRMRLPEAATIKKIMGNLSAEV